MNSRSVPPIAVATAALWWLAAFPARLSGASSLDFEVRKVDMVQGSLPEDGGKGSSTYTAADGTVVTASPGTYDGRVFSSLRYLFDGSNSADVSTCSTDQVARCYWMSAGENPLNANLEIAFPKPQHLSFVRIRPIGDGHGVTPRSANIRVEVEDAEAGWTPKTDGYLFLESRWWLKWGEHIDVPVNAVIDHLKIDLQKSSGYIAIDELEFYKKVHTTNEVTRLDLSQGPSPTDGGYQSATYTAADGTIVKSSSGAGSDCGESYYLRYLFDQSTCSDEQLGNCGWLAAGSNPQGTSLVVSFPIPRMVSFVRARPMLRPAEYANLKIDFRDTVSGRVSMGAGYSIVASMSMGEHIDIPVHALTDNVTLYLQKPSGHLGIDEVEFYIEKSMPVPEVGCDMKHMTCPVPKHAVDAKYAIRGYSHDDIGPCGIQRSGGVSYFNITFADCNVSESHAHNEHVYTLSLVPNLEVGSISFMDWPRMDCICRIDMTSGVTSAIVSPTITHESLEMHVGFTPTFRMFSDDSFAQPLTYNASGGGYRIKDVSSFFIELSSPLSDDIVSVQGCTAKPAAKTNGTYAQAFWQDYCPVDLFNATYHFSGAANKKLMSLRAFKFAGFDSVLLTCHVVRCSRTPCGVCGEEASIPEGLADRVTRRLEAANVRKHATVAVSLKLPRGSSALVLPGDISTAPRTTVYSGRPANMLRQVVWQSSVTMFNGVVTDSKAFIDLIAKSLVSWVDIQGIDVVIIKISAMGVSDSEIHHRGRFGGLSVRSAEAAVVEFGCVPSYQDAHQGEAVSKHIQSLLQANDLAGLAEKIRSNLKSNFGFQVNDLLVVKGGGIAEMTSLGTLHEVIVTVIAAAGRQPAVAMTVIAIGLGICIVCPTLLVRMCTHRQYKAYKALVAVEEEAPVRGNTRGLRRLDLHEGGLTML